MEERLWSRHTMRNAFWQSRIRSLSSIAEHCNSLGLFRDTVRHMRSRWASQAWAVFRKDVAVETRTKVNVNAMLFFAGMVLLIFSFALGPDPARLRSAAPGLLWVAFIFSGLLAFGRSY